MNFVNKLSKLGANLASLALVLLTTLVLVEIFGRTFFSYSTMIADEYSGYLYLAIVSLGLAYTFTQKAHIRISLIYGNVSRKKQVILDILASFLLTCLLIFALIFMVLSAIDAKDLDMLSEQVSQTPIYLTQIPLIIGTALFVLASFAFFLKRLFYDF